MKNSLSNLIGPYKGLPKEIYIIFIARIVNALGMFVFPLLTLLLTKKLGYSKELSGIIVTIGGLLFMAASLIGGKLADTVGRKKLIILFDSLAAICYLSCALITPSAFMVALIMLAGFFMGVADPAHNSIIADLTTPDNRDGAYSLTYLGFNIGFAVGPAVGGMLFENHLRLFFFIDAFTALCAMLLVLFFVKETIHEVNAKNFTENALEKHEKGSILSVLLKRPVLLAFSFVAIGYNFVYAQWGFLFPLHVESNYPDMGSKLFGILSSFNGIIVMVFTALVTTLMIKKSNISKLVIGGIIYTIGFGMLGFVSTKTAFFASVFIFTIGEILVTISFMPFIANQTPASHRGRMNSILPLIMGLGHTFGPLITGALLKSHSYSVVWQIIGIVMLVSTFLMYMIQVYSRKHSELTVNIK